MNVARIHILVVDGLPEAADIMIELLSIWGYEGAACYSGEEALKSASLRRPTVVLLDLAMPRMNGFQFTKLLHKLPGCSSLPIIAISGYSSLDYRNKAREAEIRHYLLKPADPERVRDLLASEIELATLTKPFAHTFTRLPDGFQCVAQEVVWPGGLILLSPTLRQPRSTSL
jgi:CheY-like chemotaxis protein